MEAAKGCKRKVLVRGNHDKNTDLWYMNHGWDFVCNSFTTQAFGHKLIFSHVAVPHDIRYDFNIHGHSHGNDHRDEDLKAPYVKWWNIDVAPELYGWSPIKLENLLHTAEIRVAEKPLI